MLWLSGMSLATVHTAAIQGLDAAPVQVEVDMALGMPHFDIVGVGETTGKSAKVRVLAAIRNSGFALPQKRVTVSLAPASLRKESAAFDLPIALGVLAAAGHLNPEVLRHRFFAGELSLNGELRSVAGALPLAVLREERPGPGSHPAEGKWPRSLGGSAAQALGGRFAARRACLALRRRLPPQSAAARHEGPRK